MNYISRDINRQIRKFYHTQDVIVIQGAHQVGKTTLMNMILEELIKTRFPVHYIDLEDLSLVDLFNSGPEAVLSYLRQHNILKNDKLYLFVDEIQYLENPSNLLKLMHDHHHEQIKLFVSGSSTFDIRKKFKDSLVGRTVNFELYPLNFREYLRFKNFEINLDTPVTSGPLIDQLRGAFLDFALYGGYPKIALQEQIEFKQVYLNQLVQTYVKKDIRDLAEIRNIDRFNKLLRILASQCGELLNMTELVNTSGIARNTIENYLSLLESTFIVKRVTPFFRNVRSELHKMPKIYFYDSGLAHILYAGRFPPALSGEMFENVIFTELVKNKMMNIHFWRTQDKKEIDFIIDQPDALVPIEVKMNAEKLKGAALDYFQRAYATAKKYCISLSKPVVPKKGVSFIYPWDIYSAMIQGQNA